MLFLQTVVVWSIPHSPGYFNLFASLIVLRIWNSGNIPILASDYDKPITIDFDGNGEVVDGSIVKTQPTNLQPSLVLEQKSVILEPLLLNARDMITIKVLLNGTASEPVVKARISSVEKILKSNLIEQNLLAYSRVDRILMISAFTLSFLLVVYILFNLLFFNYSYNNIIRNPLTIILLIAVLIMSVLGGVNDFIRRYKRRKFN